MKAINKRECRKFAFPESHFQKTNGLLHTEKVEYVVRAAIRNVDGRRMLLLYLYKTKEAATGKAVPTYTVFQTKTNFLTLERLKMGRLGGAKRQPIPCIKGTALQANALSIPCGTNKP